jgi:large conductance mechanosensitive channel
MIKEFREFIAKGNVIDLAVGVIIGAAFGKIVTSLVEDVIMPPIGMVLGRVDFSSLYISLNGQRYPSYAEAKRAGAPVIGYGQFINSAVTFLIVAIVVFLIVKQINRMRREPAPAEAPPDSQDCPYCFTSISLRAIRCPNCTSDLPGALQAGRGTVA